MFEAALEKFVMPHITLHRRFHALTLLAAGLCISIAGSGLLSAQSAPPTAGTDPYIQFLEERSMLFQAEQQAERISGEGVQWRNDYGKPEPGELVNTASVWLLYYPGSVIPKSGASVIGTWADPHFWDTMRDVGIDLIHTNPVKRAGGIRGKHYTPTIDGWFDRISLEVDPQLGTDEEFRQMVQVAAEHGAIVAEDLVPLHTGLGADFRLAERAYKDYPGLYTMVEIDSQDWPLLPAVDDPWGTALVPRESAVQLWQKGYIPGLIDSADAASGANEWSGWSATPEVVGVDGEKRRWVYLHVFKPAQPTLNWLDPSYASRRALFGDTARSLVDLGARVMRLDAVPFLGIEPGANSMTASLYLHPLSVTGANDLAFMARKLGGWTFQELNVPIEQLKDFTRNGPDLTYDFFTRAQVLHPLLTGNVLPLRLAHSLLLQLGVQAGTLIHDLQNHDEITYQLIDLGSRDAIDFEGQQVNGKQLKEQILAEMRAKAAAPFNKMYRPEQDGIATTFAGFIAPALGIQDPYNATPDQVALIRRAHLLVAHANAMIPGVFAISAWDLVGALPIPEQTVADRTQDGDFRWINRGGVDLLGANPTADKSAFGLPKAQTLYGAVPEQLQSPDSFASQLKTMLAARKQYGVSAGEMLAVPNVGNDAVCVLVMRLPNTQNLAITALNYSHDPASIEIDLTLIPPGIPAASVAGQTATDIVANQSVGAVSDVGKLTLTLDGLSGKTVMVPRQ
jgi:maltose alpha-D-glucosyltransferase/alpha-amylase